MTLPTIDTSSIDTISESQNPDELASNLYLYSPFEENGKASMY